MRVPRKSLQTPNKSLHPSNPSMPPFAFNLPRLPADVLRNSTRSLSGSFEEEYFENSRRYCNDTYFMPNDAPESLRLSIAHQAYLLVLSNQLTLARVPSTATRILDVGTGNGEWAMAVAEKFPDAEVVATDITTAFQPSTGPPNCEFELDDAREEWAYGEAFDFVHMRGMSGAFEDWGKLYAEVAKHLKANGQFEIVDRGPIKLKVERKDSWVSVFNGAVQSAAEKAGRPTGIDHLRKQMFEIAGLSVVKTMNFEVPLGPYEADPMRRVAGKMAMIAALEGLEAVSLRLLTRELGWEKDEVRELCEKVKAEVMDPEVRACVIVQYVVARKLVM